jgi:hypothetical protein
MRQDRHEPRSDDEGPDEHRHGQYDSSRDQRGDESSGEQFMSTTVPWEVALAERGFVIRDRRLVRVRGP